MLTNNLRLNFCYLKIIHIFYPRYHPKMMRHILKKNKYVCIHDIIRLIIMKMKIKMGNKSYRYDLNRPRSRHEHAYSKYKNCLSMMMLLCIKQHLGNMWSSIHQKVKQHWGCWKKALLIKTACILDRSKSKPI